MQAWQCKFEQIQPLLHRRLDVGFVDENSESFVAELVHDIVQLVGLQDDVEMRRI